VAHQRVNTPAEAGKANQAQVAASALTAHGTRVAQRQRAVTGVEKTRQDAQPPQAKLAEHLQTLGPPRQRAERDWRTQTIRPVRTLLLEHALRACCAVRVGPLDRQVR
jgi:hypothetical protein